MSDKQIELTQLQNEANRIFEKFQEHIAGNGSQNVIGIDWFCLDNKDCFGFKTLYSHYQGWEIGSFNKSEKWSDEETVLFITEELIILKFRHTNFKTEWNDDDWKTETADRITYSIQTRTIQCFTYHRVRNGALDYFGNANEYHYDDNDISGLSCLSKIIRAASLIESKWNVSNPTSKETSKKKSGCYIATAVYGSYECPQVRVLRRYRDKTLKTHWYGRILIQIYYLVSPIVIRIFGKSKWFNAFWHKRIDRIVSKLRKRGYKDTYYDDR